MTGCKYELCARPDPVDEEGACPRCRRRRKNIRANVRSGSLPTPPAGLTDRGPRMPMSRPGSDARSFCAGCQERIERPEIQVEVPRPVGSPGPLLLHELCGEIWRKDGTP
jgi:hypothetical protein